MGVEGAKEMIAALKLLGTKGSQCIRQAQRDAAKISQASCFAECPEVTGITKAAIKVRAGKRKRDRVSMVVQIGEGDFKGETFYAAFVLYGHKVGKRPFKSAEKEREYIALGGKARQFIPGNNWMKKGWDRSAGQASKTWENNMKGYLDKAVEEAAKGKQ